MATSPKACAFLAHTFQPTAKGVTGHPVHPTQYARPMKIGLRKPSLKKSIKARTTGRAKRAIKRKVIPGYGRKGMGWLRDPKRAAYNAVYRRTTVGLGDVLKMFK